MDIGRPCRTSSADSARAPVLHSPAMRRLLALLTLALLGPLPLAAQAADFTLRPGDRVEVQVLRDETLSGVFFVDEDGVAVLPLLGPRQMTRTPWPQLRDSLQREMGRQLNDAGLRFIPLRRVFVLGYVDKPGPYFVDPTVPIAGAIAAAGGAAADGDLRRIRVLRDGAVLMANVPIDDPRVLQDLRSGDQVFVERRGWFDRNSPFFVSALVGLAGIAATIIVAK